MIMNSQYVYIMSNPSLESDLYKIGFSRRHPSIRAKELYSSGVPTPFFVEYVIITENGQRLECDIHKRLESYRLNSKREFFKIRIHELVEILENDMCLELSDPKNIGRLRGKNSTQSKLYKNISELQSLNDRIIKKHGNSEIIHRFNEACDKNRFLIEDHIKHSKSLTCLLSHYDEKLRVLEKNILNMEKMM